MNGSPSVIVGDAWELAGTLEPESVDCVVSSPPYWGLRDYGVPGQFGLEPHPSEYVAKLVDLFVRLRPTLKPTATIWLNLGDTYFSGVLGETRNTNRNNRTGGSQAVREMRTTPRGVEQDGSAWLRPKQLLLIPSRVAIAMQDAGFLLRNDVVWCLGGGTKLWARTQKGVRPEMLKDLSRLDPSTVELWCGYKWVRVKQWERVETEDGLEVEFRNGQRVSCTRDHKWPVGLLEMPAKALQPGDVVRDCILPGPIATEPNRLPDDLGWFVGLFMAEGSFGKNGTCLQFSLHAEELRITERLHRVAAAYDASISVHDYGHQRHVNIHCTVLAGVVKKYLSGTCAKDKHLTSAAWSRGDAFLRNFMYGYLAGDGHEDPHTNRWRLGFTCNHQFADDMRCIAARLGASVHLKRCNHSCNGTKYPGYKGDWRWDPSERNAPDGEVVAIRKAKSRVFYNLEVEEPNLFALASGILSHNSKPNPMPSSVKDRFSCTWEHLFLFSVQPRYYFDLDAVREAHSQAVGSGYLKKCADWRERPNNGQWDDDACSDKHMGAHPSGKNPGDVWRIATAPFPEAHFATFPPSLPERCLKSGCPTEVCAECGKPKVRVVKKTGEIGTWRDAKPEAAIEDSVRYTGEGRANKGKHMPPQTYADLGFSPTCDCAAGFRPGLALDPFAGAGTTLCVAKQLGLRATGFELSEEYAAMARKRIAEWKRPKEVVEVEAAGQATLFDD